MHLTITRENLKKLMSAVSGVTIPRTLPALKNIRLEAAENSANPLHAKPKLEAAKTNLDIHVRALIEASVIQPGAALVEAALFEKIVAELSADQVTLQTSANELTVTAGTARFTLALSNESFPPSPRIDAIDEDNPPKTIPLPQGALAAALKQTIYATSQDTQRPILNSVFLEISPDGATLTATDGRRLNHVKINGDANQADKTSALLPNKLATELQRHLDGGDKPIITTIGRNIRFVITPENEKTPRVQITGKIHEGNFPTYQNIIPDPDKTAVILSANRDSLRAAIRRASIACLEATNPLTLDLRANRIDLSGQLPSGTTANEVCVCERLRGEDLTIRFSPKLLLDFLEHAPEETIHLHFNKPVDPLLGISNGLKTVIMPCRSA